MPVVLEPNQPEQFLTEVEPVGKLKGIWLKAQQDLPRELQKFTSIPVPGSVFNRNYARRSWEIFTVQAAVRKNNYWLGACISS